MTSNKIKKMLQNLKLAPLESINFDDLDNFRRQNKLNLCEESDENQATLMITNNPKIKVRERNKKKRDLTVFKMIDKTIKQNKGMFFQRLLIFYNSVRLIMFVLLKRNL